jgi:hypothetical protein
MSVKEALNQADGFAHHLRVAVITAFLQNFFGSHEIIVLGGVLRTRGECICHSIAAIGRSGESTGKATRDLNKVSAHFAHGIDATANLSFARRVLGDFFELNEGSLEGKSHWGKIKCLGGLNNHIMEWVALGALVATRAIGPRPLPTPANSVTARNANTLYFYLSINGVVVMHIRHLVLTEGSRQALRSIDVGDYGAFHGVRRWS